MTNKEKEKASEVHRIRKESKAEETIQILLSVFSLGLLKMGVWREERESLLVWKRVKGFGVEKSFGAVFGKRESGEEREGDWRKCVERSE